MMRKKMYCLYCGTSFIEKMVEKRVRLFCTNCKEPYYENPVPASCLVVIDNRERVILVKRNVEPQIGLWCLPGGFMELGETPEDVALRELKEETGLTGRIDRLLGVTSSYSSQYYSVLLIGYLVKSFTGILSAGDDASDVASYHPERLPDIAFSSHKKFIRAYYAGNDP